MNQKITRRQLGRLAIAFSSTTAIGFFASKSFGQNSSQVSQVIYGVGIDYTNNTNGRLVIRALDLTTGQISNVTNSLVPDPSVLNLQPREQLTGLTFSADDSLLLSSVASQDKQPRSARIKPINKSSAPTTTISGSGQVTMDGLISVPDGSVLALSAQSNNAAPSRLSSINPNTGSMSSLDFNLPPNQRFGALVRCQDGTVYTTTVGQLGETTLVRLDLQQRQVRSQTQLRFNGEVWDSGVRSLACSPSGQLFALAAPRYESPYSLYTIDPATGEMRLFREFDVFQIAFNT